MQAPVPGAHARQPARRAASEQQAPPRQAPEAQVALDAQPNPAAWGAHTASVVGVQATAMPAGQPEQGEQAAAPPEGPVANAPTGQAAQNKGEAAPTAAL